MAYFVSSDFELTLGIGGINVRVSIYYNIYNDKFILD